MMPLPCPYCGGTSGHLADGDAYRWKQWACDECGALGPEVRANIFDPSKDHDASIKEWNKRTALTPQPADSVAGGANG